MKSAMRIFILLVVFGSVTLGSTTSSEAALPPEVKKEIADLSRELRTVSSIVRKKEIDEAKAVIQKVEDRLEEFEIADVERDRSYKSLVLAISKAKALIPVSFESEIAPIVKQKCVQCHGEGRASNNLRMDTYANMGKGGQNGPLLIPRNARRSLIMARVMAEGAGRMPKNGEQLGEEEINLLGRWIQGGAAFDGMDMTAPIGDSMAEKKPPKPKVKVVMADGSETISFKEDVAPWMINVCGGCHMGNNPRGGYNITTFEQLLTDGNTGSTIVPGDPDSSYIVDLVLRQDPLKMPAGNQTQIKKSQALALEKWIKEGAHFDGVDPKATVRSLVPTEEELEAARLLAMSDEDFSQRRMDQAESIWTRVAPREQATSTTTENLYVYGNAPQSRLEDIAAWGEEQVARLTEKYKLPEGQKAWRGRLIVFVSKSRFDYEEFNTVLMNRRTPRGVNGHSKMTPNLTEAYVAMFDVGDEDIADSLNAKQLVGSLIAQSYLGRDGTGMPDWLQQGFGLLESGAEKDSPYFASLPRKAAEALSTVTNPGTLFDNGTLAPDEVGPVGFLLTRFLITRGGVGKLSQYVGALKTARNAGRAIQTVYGQNANALGQAFLQSGGR